MRFSLIIICLCFTLQSFSQNGTDRATIEEALVQYKSLDKNPQLLLLESILEKSETNFSSGDTTLTKVYRELANWYFTQREYKKALVYFGEQETALRNTEDSLALGMNLTQQGICNFRQYKTKLAKSCFEESINLNHDLTSAKDFDNYINLAGIFWSEGNYNLQIEYAKHALSLASSPAEKCHAYYQLFRGNIWLKNYEDCKTNVEKQLEISSREGLYFERGSAYFCLAWLRSKEEKHQESINYYDKAISYYKRSDSDLRHEKISYCYSGMGSKYNRLKKNELAVQYAKLAVEESIKFHRKDFHARSAIHYHNLAVRYMRSGDYESGIRQVQNAIKCFLEDPDFSDSRATIPRDKLYNVPVKWDLLRSIQDKALCYAHLYIDHNSKEDARTAELHLSNAVELIEIMRAELSTEDTKVMWRGRIRHIYDYAIEISDWLGDEGKMLKYMEKSRSLLLLDELNHKDALDMIPEHLAIREQKLRENFTSENSGDISKYAEYNGFLDSLQNAYPHYYEYKFEINTPTIATVQNSILNDSTLVLQYHLTSDSIYIHSITENSTELITNERPEDLEENVSRLLELVSNKDSLEFKSNFKEFLDLSGDLYALLFEGLTERKANVIILGDGVLNYLPFDLLITGIDPEGYPEYLLEQHVFSNAPSLAVLLKLKGKKKFNNLMVVSPEEFDEVGFTPLVLSAEEINSLEQLSATTSYRRDEATFENFLADSPRFDVIHFTSHSGLDSLGTPWIAFKDSLVDLKQIYKLKLNASLVTLSSCKSYDGKSHSGEGVNSLARAFLFADASAVVGSTWNLNEASGLAVLENFYERIKGGSSKAKALRDAKLKYIRNNPYKSPHYWAPLVLMGDPGALEVSSKHSHLGWLFIIGLLALLVVTIKRFF